MDDFNLFSLQDRQDISYAACIGGSVILGGMVGSFSRSTPGILIAAAVGLALGLLACKQFNPAIEKKIFSGTERLSEGELLSALRVVRDQTGVQTKSEAMYLLSQARSAAIAKGDDIRNKQNSCVPPRIAASQLLSMRA